MAVLRFGCFMFIFVASPGLWPTFLLPNQAPQDYITIVRYPYNPCLNDMHACLCVRVYVHVRVFDQECWRDGWWRADRPWRYVWWYASLNGYAACWHECTGRLNIWWWRSCANEQTCMCGAAATRLWVFWKHCVAVLLCGFLCLFVHARCPQCDVARVQDWRACVCLYMCAFSFCVGMRVCLYVCMYVCLCADASIHDGWWGRAAIQSCRLPAGYTNYCSHCTPLWARWLLGRLPLAGQARIRVRFLLMSIL